MSDLIRGNQLLRSGKLEEAVAAYQSAIAHNPSFHWSHYKLGEALEKLGRCEDAAVAYRNAIKLKSNCTWSHHKSGVALAESRRADSNVSPVYRTYNLELSDSGYFFKRNEVDEPNYLWQNSQKVFPSNENYAKSILVLGQDELYVVLWNSGLWFLDADLNLIANENLLIDPNLQNSHYAQLWRSYLEDILPRIWYALNTPGFLQKFPAFVPEDTFIHDCVSQDVNQIMGDFNPPFCSVTLAELDNQVDLLSHHLPPIQKDYLLYSLGTEVHNWQEKAILAGFVEIRCPFSGQVIQSNESIYSTSFTLGKTLSYRFESHGEIFFLISGIHTSGKVGFYFPRRNTAFWTHRFYDGFLGWFLISIARDWQLIKPYLLNKNKTREIAVLALLNPHVGHNLYNDLSALERLDKNNILSQLPNLYLFGQEMWAPTETLFPTLQGKIRPVSSTDQLQDFYKDNKLVIVVGDNFILKSIADKIISYSLSSSVRESLSQNLQEFCKEKFSLVILFTLRFQNRSWLEQEKGICEIIVGLSETFSGSIALVIDGKNTTFNGDKMLSFGEGFYFKEELSEIEYNTAERIKNTISSDRITVINTIDCSLPESINWSLLCDFFVAPWGAGLAKCKWITNTPGLIYSSRKVLTGRPDLRIYDGPTVREDASPCEYVDSAMVFDEGNESSLGEGRDNFSLSLGHLYDKIVSMCKRFGRVRMRSYQFYNLELSDSGYFFKRNEVDEPHYLWQNSQKVFPPNNEYYAKSILVLGQDELYVVLWNSGLWFLDADLNLVTNQSLLIDPNLQNSHYAKLWRSYLEDILPRIFYALNTPGLLHDFPAFAPEETFIHDCVLEDVKQIMDYFNPPFCQVSLDELDNQVHLLNRHYPPIQKDYLLYSLDLGSGGMEIEVNNFQQKRILAGYVEIKCPFSGQIIQSNESIYSTTLNSLVKTVCYRFESHGEIFFLISGIHTGGKAGFYFPRRNTAFWKYKLYGDFFGDFSCTFLAGIARDWQLIKPYLLNNNKSREIAVLAFLNPHLGHNLYNDLSAMERLDRNNILSQLPNLYLFVGRDQEMWAPTEEIFPTLQGKIRRVYSTDQIQDFYKDNKFVITVVDDHFIPKSLADKIINYSLSSSVRESLSQNLQEFCKEKFSLVILFTLRFQNRSWLEQEKGICEIIVGLSETFSGSIALVIDGKNTTFNGDKMLSFGEGFYFKEELSEIEYNTAERIKNTISSDRITVINTIDCSLPESINWSLLCDFFVAPWGAGLAKYKWITNTPGLIYSSRKVLMEKGDLHIYDSPEYREDAYPCEYVDPLMVFDQGDDIRVGQPFRDDFSLSLEHLYDKIVSMCERFGRVNESNVNFEK